ncbi:MAG: hypothetical protein N2043_09680, partial [Ignavibacterium sp.]|nr:hypothetical protein [Ignavibacterium sp.]
MLNVILYLYQKRNDVPSGLDFPTKDLPPVSYSDVTNSVLEDGISINKRMEYDDFESIAFDTCEITFSETPVIKDYLIRQLQKNLFVVLIEIRFSGDLIFFGIIQQNSIVRNRYNETISCKADSLLKNLIDFWDNIP